jgi:hypothetical protein
MLEMSSRLDSLGEPIVTGYRCSKLRHECTRDGCYLAALPEWEDIIACFPRNIRPTDIDGMVEINGNFLFLEEKSAKKSLDAGQRIALKELSRNPNTTVLVFRPGRAADMEVMVLKDGQTEGFQDCSKSQFLHWIQRWARNADSTERTA